MEVLGQCSSLAHLDLRNNKIVDEGRALLSAATAGSRAGSWCSRPSKIVVARQQVFLADNGGRKRQSEGEGGGGIRGWGG